MDGVDPEYSLLARLHVLRTKAPKAEEKVDEATKQEDYYRTFRTNVLLAWTLSNVSFSAS